MLVLQIDEEDAVRCTARVGGSMGYHSKATHHWNACSKTNHSSLFVPAADFLAEALAMAAEARDGSG
jgi:hypothetical protein